jgi:anaerobic magnesium-protoporphyrin IX monomethyl ester cyclase
MKILLIYPPFYRFMGYYNRYFPYGLLTLATVTKNSGHEVLLYDADCNNTPKETDISNISDQYDSYLNSFADENNSIWLEVKDIINKYDPDVLGIQVYTDFVASAFYTAKICKELKPECSVVMGGPHISVKAEEVLKICQDVDYLVIGEGEVTFLELLDFISIGSPSLHSIDGISYKFKGENRQNKPREVLQNIENYPFPDRSLLMNKHYYSSEDMGLIMTSRGCPYKCTFCVTERQLRRRSIEDIIEEMKEVHALFGTTQFTFKDDCFTTSKKRVEIFCEMLIASDLTVSWECNSRVDQINEQLLLKMKKAGCIFIKVGIESGSEKILKYINKGVTIEKMLDAARLFRTVGIHWTGYFMIGIPGETEQDILKTLDFMYQLKPNFAYFGVYQHYPGSEMYYEGIKKGLVNSEMDLKDFYSTAPNHYYKKDHQIQLENMSEKDFADIEAKIKKAVHRYNKNFFRAVQMAISKVRVYLNDPRLLFIDFKKYLRY